jgi:dTDP-4-amino-4,6-dideoxygalactose transaminase
VSRIPITKPIVTKEMLDASNDALRNERLVMGESVFKFEEEFARYIGVDHAVSVSSGTDALILAMIALDVKKKNVLTTPFSFVATGTSIVHAGGIPDFVDVSAIDYNIDPQGLGGKLDNGTGAVLPVHLFGRPAKIDEIRDRVGNDARIIEDAAQAHGAELHGRKVGSLGDVGCFSFYPTKNMTVGGDGGMVTTNDKRVADDIRKFRDCGRVSRYEHDVFGFTSRLNTANAAFGRVQLKHLDEWNERRREIAAQYHRRLRGLARVVLPPMGDQEVRPAFYVFAIRCEDRDALARHLGDNGIESAVHFPPIHLQPVFREAYGFSPGEYPKAEAAAEHMLSIPMFPGLTAPQVDFVSDKIIEFYGGRR